MKCEAAEARAMTALKGSGGARHEEAAQAPARARAICAELGPKPRKTA